MFLLLSESDCYLYVQYKTTDTHTHTHTTVSASRQGKQNVCLLCTKVMPPNKSFSQLFDCTEDIIHCSIKLQTADSSIEH